MDYNTTGQTRYKMASITSTECNSTQNKQGETLLLALRKPGLKETQLAANVFSQGGCTHLTPL